MMPYQVRIGLKNRKSEGRKINNLKTKNSYESRN